MPRAKAKATTPQANVTLLGRPYMPPGGHEALFPVEALVGSPGQHAGYVHVAQDDTERLTRFATALTEAAEDEQPQVFIPPEDIQWTQ